MAKRHTAIQNGVVPPLKPESIDALFPDGRPDWEAINFDIHCPRCGYNLRTLTHPRCPECGLDIDWRIAVEHALAQTELLFEHAWKRKPFSSLGKTIWWTLRPSSFWDRISIHDRVLAGPLIAYLLITFVAALVMLHGTCGVLAFLLAQVIRAAGNQPNIALVRSQYQLDRVANMPWTRDYRYVLWFVGIVVFQVGIIALLLALRQTWFKFQIRGVQVLRVVAYASTPIMFYGVLIGILLACLFPLYALSGPTPFLPYLNYANGTVMPTPRSIISVIVPGGLIAPWQAVVLYGAMLLSLAIASYSLAAGLSRYLKLPRSRRLAIVTVVTAGLMSCTIVALVGLILTDGWWP